MRMMVLVGVERGAKGEVGSKPTTARAVAVAVKERRPPAAATSAEWGRRKARLLLQHHLVLGLRAARPAECAPIDRKYRGPQVPT